MGAEVTVEGLGPSSSDCFSWGTEAVDSTARDLPGLKAAFLVDHLPQSGRVLDIGCGGGKLLRLIGAERPALELHGCDIRNVETNDFEFRLVADPNAPLPYPDGFADVVLIYDVLEHVPDGRRLLAEARRACSPDGVLVSFVPVEGGWSCYSLFRSLFGRDLYVITKDHVQAFTHRSLNALVAEFFEVKERQFAYHLLGQTMDAVLFALLKIPRLRRLFWQENRYYNNKQASWAGGVLNFCLMAGNRLAWLESRALRNSRVTAAGQLIAATPRQG